MRSHSPQMSQAVQSLLGDDPASASGLHWWQRDAIYQIYPLSFQDSNGDGRGDLQGILSRVEYLHWLGVGAVWLAPIYPSPMKDFGYDITDFTGVAPLFGSLDDLDELIRSLHARDIRLILDFVPNHTSDMHPWFLESHSSRQNLKRDWYLWADPDPNGGPPNNWLSRFGGSAWEWDGVTAQYYYHAFLKEQPDLNWRNPHVRAAMADVLRFWLRRGIDGFRIDAAAVLAEDQLLRDDPPNSDVDECTPPPERLKRVYTDARPEVLDWLAELRAVVDEFFDRVLLAEVDTAPERLPQFYGEANRPIVHLPLNYQILDTPWNAHNLAVMAEEYLRAVPPHGWPCWVIGSHDKKRIAGILGSEQARLAAMLFLTLPGTPIFFAGDELGMAGGANDNATALDPFERLVPGYGLNRDPARTPMQWDCGDNAGFTSGIPWLALASDSQQRNVEVESADADSLLNLYRHLLALRKREPVLVEGEFTSPSVKGEILMYRRTCEERVVLVALNLGNRVQTCQLPNNAGGQILLSTHPHQSTTEVNRNLILRAYEGLVMRIKGTEPPSHISIEDKEHANSN
jgi:alpha-glucosidase